MIKPNHSRFVRGSTAKLGTGLGTGYPRAHARCTLKSAPVLVPLQIVDGMFQLTA